MFVKNMERMTSVMLLLLLVMFGVFIESSQALECYFCVDFTCNDPDHETRNCNGLCTTVVFKRQGALRVTTSHITLVYMALMWTGTNYNFAHVQRIGKCSVH